MQPRDNKGHFVPLDCLDANCSAGRLVYEPKRYPGQPIVHVWRCDGLLDPNDPSKELEACPFSHIDGESYQPSN
jgi:hypothetical protein